MAKKKSTKKKTTKKAVKKSRPNYIREIHVSYKKKRVSDKSPINKALTAPEQVVELFRDLQSETKEKLITISLDVKMKIITFEVVGIGTVSGVYARPAESVRASIMVNAYGVIIVHNHPSGDPEPSETDKEFTKTLGRICDDLGIALHDHIIIGDDDYFSFANEDLL